MNVGDSIVIYSGSNRFVGIRTIERLTKTKLVDSRGAEWNIKRRKPWGQASNSTWNYGSGRFVPLDEVDPEKLNRQKREAEKLRLMSRLSGVNWNDVSLGAMRRICIILNNDREKKE